MNWSMASAIRSLTPVKSRQTKVERAATSKIGFHPADVPKLWQQAEQDGDFDLFAAIQLGNLHGLADRGDLPTETDRRA